MWGLGLYGPNAGGEDGCMQSNRSSHHASTVLTEPVERGVMSMFCGQRNQYMYGE